jgi:hypothetical protein
VKEQVKKNIEAIASPLEKESGTTLKLSKLHNLGIDRGSNIEEYLQSREGSLKGLISMREEPHGIRWKRVTTHSQGAHAGARPTGIGSRRCSLYLHHRRGRSSRCDAGIWFPCGKSRERSSLTTQWFCVG